MDRAPDGADLKPGNKSLLAGSQTSEPLFPVHASTLSPPCDSQSSSRSGVAGLWWAAKVNDQNEGVVFWCGWFVVGREGE